ncbi:hypothetical protein YPPY08_3825, partial [Yersinia pestis PY-08]
MHTQRAAA